MDPVPTTTVERLKFDLLPAVYIIGTCRWLGLPFVDSQ
jgi:hypothetical protein